MQMFLQSLGALFHIWHIQAIAIALKQPFQSAASDPSVLEQIEILLLAVGGSCGLYPTPTTASRIANKAKIMSHYWGVTGVQTLSLLQVFLHQAFCHGVPRPMT